jgi:hypothetical protein
LTYTSPTAVGTITSAVIKPLAFESMTRAFNHLVAGAHFEEKFRRWPLPAHDPRALVNDVIFDRMINPNWSSLHRLFVDKQTAKIEAQRLFPDILLPETLFIIATDTIVSVEGLFQTLRPFIGSNAIAKPTHASGAVTFLRDVDSPADLQFLHDLSLMDYSSILREMQYWNLPRKIIVESMIPTVTAAPPDDYKFHCVRGEPLLCQVDHARFGETWNRLFCVPDFVPMHENDGLHAPPSFVQAPAERLEMMLEAARALSAPFEFVRVDLYNGLDGIYFGELTFTPAASLGIAPSSAGDHEESETHHVYSRIMMDALIRPAIPQAEAIAEEAVRGGEAQPC